MRAAALLLLLAAPLAADDIADLAAQLKTGQGAAAADRLAELGRAASAAVPDLVAALDSADLELRWRAAWALSRMGPDAGVAAPALVRAFTADEEPTATAAGIAIARIGEGATKAILSEVRRTPAGRRPHPLYLLYRIDPDPEPTVPALLAFFDQSGGEGLPAYSVRGVFEHMGPKAAEAAGPLVARGVADSADALAAIGEASVEPLKKIAASPDQPPDVRGAAIGVLARIDGPGIAAAAEFLREGVDSKSLTEVLQGVAAAGQRGVALVPLLEARIAEHPPYCAAETLLSLQPQGVEALERLLFTGRAEVRRELIDQLAKKCNRIAVPWLLRLGAIKEPREVRVAALLALAEFRLDGAQAREAAKLASRALGDETVAACQLAGGLGVAGHPLLGKLKRLLKDDDIRVRASAASAVCELGKGGPREIKILAGALNYANQIDDYSLRLHAMRCLGRAGPVAAPHWRLLRAELVRDNLESSVVAAGALGPMFPALEEHRKEVLTAIAGLFFHASFVREISRAGDIQTLIDLLGPEGDALQCDDYILQCLIAQGPRAWKALSTALNHDDEDLRSDAGWAMVVIDPENAGEQAWIESLRNCVVNPRRTQHYREFRAASAPALFKGLESDDPSVRCASISLLGKLGHREALPALWTIARGEEKPGPRATALDAIDALLPPP